ncbi:MAG: hypothetical protein JWN86_157 [Planctomycetota bacterium]|nr:hypothetical protein [Planctomycetota bacterium]
MPKHLSPLPDGVRETVEELRGRLGLFSFRNHAETAGAAVLEAESPELGIRAGGIVEWLVAKPGAGAVTCALQTMSRSASGDGVWAFVDWAWQCYPPALSGWGISPSQTLLIRPASRLEVSWAVEQCLRCPGVAVTWAWIDQRIPARVHRRWQLAAETGGGTGVFFRPESARREPVWADLRLLITPRSGGQSEARQVEIDVLYRQGGLGGTTQVWEIDHAAGVVRLVPELVDPAIAE